MTTAELGAPSLSEITGADPAATAIEGPEAGRATGRTWAELEQRTNAIGHGLESLGLRPGDHVALVATNRLGFLEALLGAMRAGMVVTPVKTGWSAQDIGYVLANAASRAVITDLDAGRDAGRAGGVAVVDLDAGYESWLADQDSSPLPAARHGWRMSYTSGTTGRPKGVRRYVDGSRPWHEAFAATRAFNEMLHLPETGPHLNVSALYHGAPLAFSLSLLAAGVTVRILDRWDPAVALEALADGVHSTCVVPTMFRQWLALPAEQREAFHAPELRAVLHGGEPCPQPLKRQMLDWFGPLLVEYYGMTEGGMTTASSEEWLARPGTVGKATRGMEILVLGDDGRRQPAGQPGTVYFLNPQGRFFEYHDEPAKTESAHSPEGAFTVGDIGYLDEDGYLFLSGRTADVIVSGGVNVYPAEIEDVLFSFPDVLDACVVGGPDELRGETPVAFVRLTEEANRDQDVALARLDDACAARLAGYQRPRRFLARADIPRDGTGKLLRARLRDELWEGRTGFAATAPPA